LEKKIKEMTWKDFKEYLDKELADWAVSQEMIFYYIGVGSSTNTNYIDMDSSTTTTKYVSWKLRWVNAAGCQFSFKNGG